MPAKLEGGHVWGCCNSSLYQSYLLSTDTSFCSHWQEYGLQFCSALENMLLLQANHVAMQGDKGGDTVNKTSHWEMWESLPGLLGQKKRCFVFHHSCSVCLVDLFLFHTRTKEGIDISAWPHRGKQPMTPGKELNQNKINIFQVASVIHELMESTAMVQGQCRDVAVLKEKAGRSRQPHLEVRNTASNHG